MTNTLKRNLMLLKKFIKDEYGDCFSYRDEIDVTSILKEKFDVKPELTVEGECDIILNTYIYRPVTQPREVDGSIIDGLYYRSTDYNPIYPNSPTKRRSYYKIGPNDPNYKNAVKFLDSLKSAGF